MNCGYLNRPSQPWTLCLWPLNWYTKVTALQQTVTGEIGGSCDSAVEDSCLLGGHEVSSGDYRFFEWSKCHHFKGCAAPWRWRHNDIPKRRDPPIHRNIPCAWILNYFTCLSISNEGVRVNSAHVHLRGQFEWRADRHIFQIINKKRKWFSVMFCTRVNKVNCYKNLHVKRVWQELDYRIDICRVTKGGHIEHL